MYCVMQNNKVLSYHIFMDAQYVHVYGNKLSIKDEVQYSATVHHRIKATRIKSVEKLKSVNKPVP